MSDIAGNDGRVGPELIPPQEWEWVVAHLPIACVDVVPVIRDGARIIRIGLIERDSPMGRRWCHVGGRIAYRETLVAAARRHIAQTLDSVEQPKLSHDPFFVHEYFPVPVAGAGFDPRKHAVAVCYTAEYSDDNVRPVVAPQGEALAFAWFEPDQIPTEELWPGSEVMLQRLLLRPGPTRAEGEAAPDPDAEVESRQVLAFEALNARYVSHNELMWQTPVLAMTAMAFLMTIALGDGRDWARALAALLSAVVALVSFQLMAKHSASQLADAEALWELERRLGMPEFHGPPPPGRRQMWLRRWVNGRLAVIVAYMVDGKSRNWWLLAMMLFGFVSTTVGVVALLGK